MATLADAQTPNVEGTTVPRGLATSAVARCRDLMRALLRQVVIVGGPGTRTGAYGLYELMHAIGDSFSGAHSARREGDRAIEYLRVWKPLEKIARLPMERSAGIPAAVFHTWNDGRDKEYVAEDRVVVIREGEKRKCGDLTDHPYEVPFECLADHGEQARQSLVELLVIVRDLRLDRLAAGGDAPSPFRSAPSRGGLTRRSGSGPPMSATTPNVPRSSPRTSRRARIAAWGSDSRTTRPVTSSTSRRAARSSVTAGI